MNAVSTVETARVVEPKTSVSMRVHSISSTNPDAPDRKKQPRITARMAPDSTPAAARICNGHPQRVPKPSRDGLRRGTRLRPHGFAAVFDNLRLSDYH